MNGDKRGRTSNYSMATKIKPTSKQALYSMISTHAPSIVARLVKLSQSKNENVALGACKLLLNKTLPDIKSVEIVQSSILDTLIQSELDKSTPPKVTLQQRMDEMSDEEVKAYGERMIRAGQALARTGDYTPINP